MAYIEGGSVAGNDIVYEGAADKTPPVADVSLRLTKSLYFAGWSERAWGGTAGAFITLHESLPPALARAYLITPHQFRDVVRQENGNVASVGEINVDIEEARKVGHSSMLPRGFYSELIYCGERDGYPMLSFTASENRTDHRRPSEAYLRMIGSGLKEAHGLGSADTVEYFRDRPGILGSWTVDQLVQIFGHESKEPG